MAPGSLASALPAVVDRTFEKASLEGARMVMSFAEVRAAVRAGWAARRPVVLLLVYFHLKWYTRGFFANERKGDKRTA